LSLLKIRFDAKIGQPQESTQPLAYWTMARGDPSGEQSGRTRAGTSIQKSADAATQKLLGHAARRYLSWRIRF
jgi:transposase